MKHIVRSLAIASALAACNTTDDPDEEDVCLVEARYDNGTCDTDCAQADIDCFMLFEDQQQASAWFTQLEALLAQQEVREPRALVAPADPRFGRMRELLDRGWESYQRVMPVGLLAKAPELVLIDDANVNAFVARDQASNKAAWTVMVQTGALEGQPDDALLGLVMHELTHAVKLHVLEGTPDKVRVHYQVTAGEREPIGNQQHDEPFAREAITAWRGLGEEAGAYAYAELNGMPAPGSLLATMLEAAISRADLSNCETTIARANELQAFMDARIDPLTGLLVLATADDHMQLDSLTRAFLTDLRDVCLADSTLDLFELMAAHFGVTPQQIEEQFPAAERMLIAGKHIIDQITILAAERHRLMRELAARVQQDSGQDLTTLRYFSFEEEADDATVPVLRQMGMPADGLGTFFHTMLPEPALASCLGMIAADTPPPYGDLVDEHHATCWRIAHVTQLAAAPAQAETARRARIEVPATGAYRRLAGERLPRFRRASDDITHARR